MGSMASPSEIRWQTDDLNVLLLIGDDQVVRLRSILPHGQSSEEASSPYFSDPSIPLHQVRLVGEGNQKNRTARSLIQSYVTLRLKYQSHEERSEKDSKFLDVTSVDKESGVTVISHLTVYAGIPVLRATTTVKNTGTSDVVVTQVSSLTVGGLTSTTRKWWHDWDVAVPTNSWFREAQWKDQSLPDVGVDDFGVVDLPDGHVTTHASYSVSSHGSFSTGTYLPMASLKRKDSKETWLWQIENNGSWRWEIGDYLDSVYVSTTGPTNHDHAWKEKLTPGQNFTSVPASIIHVFDDYERALQILTQYRRRIRRQHADNSNLPVIFNDYMNCLMGDPDEDKIKSLLEAVLKTGAEYFVIDCGWYADDSNWWDDVGEWEPSKKRFPSGFRELLNYIKSKGLVPGLWLEPEVVGVRSVVAKQLPEEAFFQEHGARVVEKGRYQLDFRHPAVIERMDKIVDKLVLEYGAGYFKFDYNIDVIQGTDVNTFSPGAAAQEHNRAYLRWVNGLLDRHPDLVIESCSSGAQRMDYAMLATHPIQSTSDQQDPVRYAAIAAAIPSAVTPEQGATWAYPQDTWSDEVNAMTVVNSLLGRIHLSGTLDRLSDQQMALVREGMDVYKTIRADIKDALPFWPLGLPQWHSHWLALGLQTTKGDILLSIWRRNGIGADNASSSSDPNTRKADVLNLPIKPLQGKSNVRVELLYPAKFQAEFSWEADALTLRLESETAARLFRLTPA
jgi:alpha-galactosidase